MAFHPRLYARMTCLYKYRHDNTSESGIMHKVYSIRDEFLKILIERQAGKLDTLVKKLAEKNNPRVLGIKKVENLFKKKYRI